MDEFHQWFDDKLLLAFGCTVCSRAACVFVNSLTVAATPSLPLMGLPLIMAIWLVN